MSKDIKDYFNHTIEVGDILLYNQKGCHGHHSSFSEGVVVRFDKGKVVIMDCDRLHFMLHCEEDIFRMPLFTETKFSKNTINLSELFIRSSFDWFGTDRAQKIYERACQ